ncbi:MAG: hypothetical protein CM15mP95_3100 [Alphaproteobacteria bacterium]|nr:MAG: hypothetical protein CM15mP95_3100 [Alphaproteobacteria bacterium]
MQSYVWIKAICCFGARRRAICSTISMVKLRINQTANKILVGTDPANSARFTQWLRSAAPSLPEPIDCGGTALEWPIGSIFCQLWLLSISQTIQNIVKSDRPIGRIPKVFYQTDQPPALFPEPGDIICVWCRHERVCGAPGLGNLRTFFHLGVIPKGDQR